MIPNYKTEWEIMSEWACSYCGKYHAGTWIETPLAEGGHYCSDECANKAEEEPVYD